MRRHLKEQVRHCFSYLFEKFGFTFVRIKEDFCESIVVAESDKLRIRFIQDRADFFLDVGDIREPEQWINFYRVMDELRASGRTTNDYKYLNKMKAVSHLLFQHFPEILDWVSRRRLTHS